MYDVKSDLNAAKDLLQPAQQALRDIASKILSDASRPGTRDAQQVFDLARQVESLQNNIAGRVREIEQAEKQAAK